jgi:hypothetical protein
MPFSLTPRHCFYVCEAAHTSAGYVATLVTDGRPGCEPMSEGNRPDDPWCWGPDLTRARQIADEANHHLGLTDVDVDDLVGHALALDMGARLHSETGRAAERRIAATLASTRAPDLLRRAS